MGIFIYYEPIFIIYIAFLMGLSFKVSIQALENGDVHCECIRNHRNPCNNCELWSYVYVCLTVFKDEFMLFHAQTSAKNMDCNHHRNHFPIGDSWID